MSLHDEPDDLTVCVCAMLIIYAISLLASGLALALLVMTFTVGAPLWLQVAGSIGGLWLVMLVCVSLKDRWA